MARTVDMRATMLKLGFASVLAMTLAFVATAPACSTVENKYNCDQICDRYADCFDQSYDTDACQADCEAQAEDDAFADKAEDCEACIDDRSCSGSFACVDECAGIVP
jgi:hypothetical protein